MMKFNRLKAYKYSFFIGLYVALIMYAVTIAGMIVFKDSFAFYIFVFIDVLISLGGFAKFINWNVKNNPMLREEDTSSGAIDLSEYAEQKVKIHPRWLADYVTLVKIGLIYRHCKNDNMPSSLIESFNVIADSYFNELSEEEKDIADQALEKLDYFFDSLKEEENDK